MRERERKHPLQSICERCLCSKNVTSISVLTLPQGNFVQVCVLAQCAYPDQILGKRRTCSPSKRFWMDLIYLLNGFCIPIIGSAAVHSMAVSISLLRGSSSHRGRCVWVFWACYCNTTIIILLSCVCEYVCELSSWVKHLKSSPIPTLTCYTQATKLSVIFLL